MPVSPLSAPAAAAAAVTRPLQLNGYEIARLPRALGLCTSETIAKHTTKAIQFLPFGADGACVFLRCVGCSVQAYRPLACQLYPLRREGDAAGGECFASLETHPRCAGAWGLEGSVAGYLHGQGSAISTGL